MAVSASTANLPAGPLTFAARVPGPTGDAMSAPVMTGTGRKTKRARDHYPLPPGWTCTDCEAEWPCSAAKARMLIEAKTARSHTVVYLSISMVYAAIDLWCGSAPPVLFERFLGWLK
jgi:hypothetical protein